MHICDDCMREHLNRQNEIKIIFRTFCLTSTVTEHKIPMRKLVIYVHLKHNPADICHRSCRSLCVHNAPAVLALSPKHEKNRLFNHILTWNMLKLTLQWKTSTNSASDESSLWLLSLVTKRGSAGSKPEQSMWEIFFSILLKCVYQKDWHVTPKRFSMFNSPDAMYINQVITNLWFEVKDNRASDC